MYLFDHWEIKCLYFFTVFIPNLAIPRNDIQIWPHYQEVPHGQSFLIYCNTRDPPVWHHDKKYLPAKRDFLLFYKAYLFHSGMYTCIGTESDRRRFIARSIVQVIVPEKPIYGIIYPSKAKAPLFGAVLFQCYSNGPTSWSRKDKPMPFNTVYPTDTTLFLDNISFDNDGVYVCKGTDNYNKTFYAHSDLILYDQSRIAPKKIRARPGSTLRVHCYSATCSYWTFNGGQVLENVISICYHGLIIYQVTSQNMGLYECLGTTEEKNNFASRAILIVLEEQAHRIPRAVIRGHYGQSISIGCKAVEPYQWKYYGRTPPADLDTYYNPTSREFYLVFKMLHRYHAGTYSCEGDIPFLNRGFYADVNLVVYGPSNVTQETAI